MIGTSAAIRAGTRGLPSPSQRRRIPIRAAVPSWAFSWLASEPMPAAWYSRRRPQVAPAASTDLCHASVRNSCATSCSSAAIPRMYSGADRSDCSNAWRFPYRT
jgi:hypothetical protein